MNFLTVNGKPQTHNGKLLKLGENLAGDSVLQLAKPTNLNLNGTVLSWNKVENAEKYAILVDGVVVAYVE